MNPSAALVRLPFQVLDELALRMRLEGRYKVRP